MELLQFLNESYTAFHAVDNVCKILKQNSFEQLVMGDKWKLVQGKGYFVVQNGSSVVAFKVGANKAYNICESHTDSPAFKLKGASVTASAGLARLNTEKYGGGLLYSFFDRPLKIAGRLLCQTEKGVEQQLVVSPYNVVIPSLAIHHNPTANDGVAINLQNDTLPIFAQGDADVLASLTDKKVLDADLFAVPATPAFFAGANNEFLCSPRIDNLTSVFASVNALVAAKPRGIAVVACLDNEEIGSGTRQGSPNFLHEVIALVEDALGFSATEKAAARQNGMVLSVDNGHAVHPAHPEKSDVKMTVHMNGGVVIKHHPNYATDGLSSAILKDILQRGGVAYQDYYNRSDVRCGSTLGLVTARELNIKTCDIGLAQLAMHSACETVGANDIVVMQKALGLFLETELVDRDTSVTTR